MEYSVPWQPLEEDTASAIMRDIEGTIPANHILYQRYHRPIAETIDQSGDTLFILNEESTECAVVHIQWKDGKQYVLGVCSSSHYDSLDIWRHKRMEVDHNNTEGDVFGWSSSDRMPRHLFYRALELDHSTAIRASIDKQNYSVCPRHWYIDATFRCEGCNEDFLWTATEQRAWFEDYGFYVDSIPKECKACRTKRRAEQAASFNR